MMRKWTRFQLGTPGVLFAVAVTFLITPSSVRASSLLTLVNCGVSNTLDSIAVAFNCADAAGLGLVGSMNQVGTTTSDTIMLNPLTVSNPTANLILDDTITIMNTYGFASPGPGSLAASYNVSLKSPNGALGGEMVGAQSVATTFAPNPAMAPTFTFAGGFGNQLSGTQAKTVMGAVAGPGTLTGTITITNLGPGESLTFPATFDDTVVPEPSTWTMMLIGFAGLGLARYQRFEAKCGKRGGLVN